MFTRIVKMEFEEENVNTFLDNFDTVRGKIRNFPGCTFLELYRDKKDQTTFFTYSRWKDEGDLENYRTSELFREVWNITKPMFRSKADAWSVDTVVSIP